MWNKQLLKYTHVRITLEDFLDYIFLLLAYCLRNDGKTYGHVSVCASVISSVASHLKCESIYYAKI